MVAAHDRQGIMGITPNATVIAFNPYDESNTASWEAIKAGEQLAAKGIDAEIINIHTIKPLDEEAILNSVMKTRCVVSAEEHNRIGGLGDSIAQVLSRNYPLPMEYVAVNDSFGESGKPEALMKKYGLDDIRIIEAAEKVLKRK